MTNPFDADDGTYIVLINGEGQYSLWPAARTIPAGWLETGPRGSRRACLAWIDENWSDLRPKRLIEAMKSSSPVAP